MKTTYGQKLVKIRLNSDRSNKVKGFYDLIMFGPVSCLPNDEYVVPEESINVLKQNKIEFELLG